MIILKNLVELDCYVIQFCRDTFILQPDYNKMQRKFNLLKISRKQGRLNHVGTRDSYVCPTY